MKKLFIAALLCLGAIAFAPKASADDCGYWAQGTRIESRYVPGYVIGYTREGYPIYSQGYYQQIAVPYSYWVSRPCVRYYPQPQPRHYPRGPRIRINFSTWFR